MQQDKERKLRQPTEDSKKELSVQEVKESEFKAIISLLETIALLRSEEGCPWDRAQTHHSLIPYLEEEAAEVIEALLKEDASALKEELGDLLLQILLHAEIASEQGEFNFIDVAITLEEKIKRRHPHLFAGKIYLTEKAQKADWEAIKAKERLAKGLPKKKGLLEEVGYTLSSIKRAENLQNVAAKVGFDWPEITPVFAKVEEEYQEFLAEYRAQNQNRLEAEFGDLLFSLINLARFMKIDPERALNRTNLKFSQRFAYIERHLPKGKTIEEMTLQELDQLWEEAKLEQKGSEDV